MKIYKLHVEYGCCSEAFDFFNKFVLIDGAEVVKEYGIFKSFFLSLNPWIETINYGFGYGCRDDLWEDLERGTIFFLETKKEV